MTLEELEKLCEEARDERWMSDFLKASIDIIPNLIAVARAARMVYPSDDPGQEEHELFQALTDALDALEKP